MEDTAPYLPRGLTAEEMIRRASLIRGVCFDVDGTLTDGRIFYSEWGGRGIAFGSHDGHGIAALVEAGFKVAWVTANYGSVIQGRASKLGVHLVLCRVTDKEEAVNLALTDWGFGWDSLCYVGDDVNDIPAMRRALLAVAVADATGPALEVAHWVTRRGGGRGAAREVCDLLLDARKEG